MDDRQIFFEALNRPKPEERAAYLDEACGDDTELRQRVELLLAAHEDAGSFLEKSPDELLAALERQEEVDLDSWKELLTPSENDDCLGLLGQYEILELIGRGGMGVVLSARDPQLNRVVAVKMLAPELTASAVSVRRFLREAKAAAAVSHDHVITIHAVDEQAKPPLIVMERIAGQSLQEKIDIEGPLDVKSILRIGMQTASGLAAAHKQGLIHRDIKPSNILLENGIERVKLTDFGLARAVDDIGMTRTGQITGTPQYMSPEQAQGHPIDHRTDLFSLGCVLYAMCTGQAAFRADSAVAVMHRVVHENPKPIREINEDVPDWLCRIVEKLMEKDPERRFSSASEVEDLLGRHLAHLQQPDSVPQPEMVQPSEPTSLHELQPVMQTTGSFLDFWRTPQPKDAKRIWIPMLVLWGSWMFILIAAMTGGASEATQELILAVGGGLLLPLAFVMITVSAWLRARRDSAVDPSETNDRDRNKSPQWFRVVLGRLLLAALVIPGFLFLSMKSLANGLLFAACITAALWWMSRRASKTEEPESVQPASSAAAGRTARHFASTRGIRLADFFLLACALSIFGWRALFDDDSSSGKDHLTPKGRLVVNTAYEEDVTVKIKGPEYSVTSDGSFDRRVPPGEYLIIAWRTLGEGNAASYAGTHTVRQNQTTTVDLEQELARPGIADFDAIQPFLADGPEVATLHITVDDPDVRLTINGANWNIAGRGEQTVPLKPGGYAFLGRKDSEKAFERAIALKAGEERSLTLESSWESAAAIAESNANAEEKPPATIRLWKEGWKQSREMSPILDIDEKEDGTWMATGHRSGFLYLWDLYYAGDSRYGFRTKHENSRIYDIEFSPDDQHIAWVQSNGQLRLRKASKHQISTIDKFPTVDDTFRSLAWSPDNKTILAGGRGKLYVWNIDQQEGPVATVDVPGNALVLDIAYSPRDKEFATALADGNLVLWNAEQITPAVKTILHEAGGKPAHAGEAHAVAYSPTEPLLVSCGADGDVRGWYLDEPDRPFWTQNYVNGKAMLSVQVSHDGKMCAAVGEDRQLHLFDIHTLDSLIEGPIVGTEVHDAEITSVCFSWSDDILTTGSADGVIKKWYYRRPVKTDNESPDWRQLLSQAASIPLNEWNTLAGDVKGPDAAAVRGEPLSLVLLNLNPFEAAKKNENVRQEFWYLTETLPPPQDIEQAIGISREKGYVSFLQPEYITHIGILKYGDPLTGFAGFAVPKLYSGGVHFKASRQNGTWQITEFTLPNYGITLRPDEQGLWQRENSTVPVNITIGKDGSITIQSILIDLADLDKALGEGRKSMGERRVVLKCHPDAPVKKVEEVIDLVKKHGYEKVMLQPMESEPPDNKPDSVEALSNE